MIFGRIFDALEKQIWGAGKRDGNFLTRLRVYKVLSLKWQELFYKLHLKIRLLHDITYLKSKFYKRYSDSPFSKPIHRAVFASFIISFIIFSGMQYVFPYLDFFKPSGVRAGSNSVTWTTKGDFNNGTTKTGNPIISGNNDNDDSNVSLPKVSVDNEYVGTSSNLTGLDITSSGEIYIASSNPNLIKGNISSNKFYSSSFPNTSSIDITFISNSTGYIFGVSGSISKTSDSGTTWTTQTCGAQSLLGSYFVNSEIGFAVGGTGTICKTVNSGSTWSSQSSGLSSHIYDVKFIDQNTGFVVGDSGKILKTTNGGSTWVTKTSNTTNNLRSVHFVDSLIGYAVGASGTILKTTDGGENWTLSTSGTAYLNSIYFTDSSTGYIVGANGKALKTTDSGNTWNSLTSVTTNDLTSIKFVNSNTAYVVGGKGIILKTTDAGATWLPIISGTLNLPSSTSGKVQFLDSQLGYLATTSYVLKTTDGGITWAASPKVDTLYSIQDMEFTSSEIGYVALGGGLIKKTTNGGSTWNTVKSVVGTPIMNSVDFIDDSIGFVVGNNGNIVKTTDGGTSWSTLSSGTTDNLYSVKFINSNLGFAVGFNTTILKTTDGGSNWTKISYAGSALNSVDFLNETVGYTVGANGLILKTTDGGSNWFSLTSPVSTSLKEISIYNESNILIVGDSGVLLKSTNGVDFSAKNSGFNSYLTGISFLNENTGFIVGYNSTLLKFSNSYTSPASISNIKLHPSSKTSWSNIAWNGVIPAGTEIKFRTRSSSTESGLALESWSVYLTNSGVQITSTSNNWLEIEASLISSGIDTPVLNDITVTYDSLESPNNNNLTLNTSTNSVLKSNSGVDITNGRPGGYTNESSIKVIASDLTCGLGTPENPVCSNQPTNIWPEVEIKPIVDGVATVFNETGLVEATPGNNYIIATGLAPGQYHLRVRAKDDDGRVSAWTSYGDNVENDPDFTIEQTAPTGSVLIDGGATYSKNTNKTVTLTLFASDGESSPTKTDLDYRLSNNGEIWSNWTDYPADDTVSNWDLTTYGGTGEEGTNTVFVQYMDNAGNISGQFVETNSAAPQNFNGSVQSGISISGNEVKLSAAYSNIISVDYSKFIDSDEVGYTQIWSGTDPNANRIRLSSGGVTLAQNVVLQIKVPIGGTVVWSGTTSPSSWVSLTPGQSVEIGYYISNSNNYAEPVAVDTMEFGSTVLPVSASYSSKIFDQGLNSDFTNISWSANLPTGTTASGKVRSGNTATPDGSWTEWVNVSNGDVVPTNVKVNRYLQYQLVLNSDPGRTLTPTVYDVTVNSAYKDSISLDTQPPANISSVSAYSEASVETRSQINEGTWYGHLNPYFEWTTVADAVEYQYCITNINNPNCNPSISTGSNNNVTLNMTNQVNYPDGRYRFRVVAIDIAGNTSLIPTPFVYSFDRTVPGVVTGFTASQNNDTQIILNWNSVSDNGSPVKYRIERLKFAFYDDYGYFVNDVEPDKVWSTAGGTSGYAEYPPDIDGQDQYTTDLSYPDTAVTLGFKYVYRIKAYDDSGKSGEFGADVITGLTNDYRAPLNPPTISSLDFNNVANRGHEIKILWKQTIDEGVGISHYNLYRTTGDPNSEGSYQKVAEYTTTPEEKQNLFQDLEIIDITNVNDNTIYYYRITAVDSSNNETDIVLSPLYSNDVNCKAGQTPDVTPPPIPVLSVSAGGPDGIDHEGVDGEGNPITYQMQKTIIQWTQPAGENSDGDIKYILYKANRNDATNQSETLLDGDFAQVANEVTNTISENITCNFAEMSCEETGLLDYRWYYYRVVAVDSSNNESNFSTTATAKTLSSSVPTPPKGRILYDQGGITETYPYIYSKKGEVPTVANNIGHEIEIKFSGSYAKDCDINVGLPCIVKYEIYRSTNNIDWTKVLDDIIPAANKIKDDRATVYTRTDTNLADVTRYYYKIKVIGNNPDVEGGGEAFSGIGGNTNQGWDITPDATAPILPLEVRVKDIHDDGTNFKRNIITWARITQPQRNGVNDFKEYRIYRSTNGLTWFQICQDGINTVYRTSCDMTYPNPLYDANKEIGLATNYFMDLIPISESNQYYYYYVTAVDDAETFKYPNNSVINQHPNESLPNKNGEGNIIAVSLNPYIAKPTITKTGEQAPKVYNVGVSSATVEWYADQLTDSVVEFKAVGDSKWVTIGDRVPKYYNEPHIVNLFGLQPKTTYEYKLISRNDLGNEDIIGDIESEKQYLPTLTTNEFLIDGASVKYSTTTTGAVFEFSTNIDAQNVFVEYQMQKQPGDDSIGGSASPSPEAIIASPRNHKVVIGGLKSNRTYNFKIKAISKDNFVTQYPDALNNNAFGSFATKSFDTSQFAIAPSSSNVAERNITATTAQIVWQTTIPSTSWVDYSTTSGKYDNSAGDNQLTLTHVVMVDGLVPGTKYYYRVRSKDGNDVEYTSQEYTFTAVLKPKISNMRIKDVTPYSVTISWDTNVDTETLINWGKSAAYGEKRGIPGMTKVHEIKVDNLEDNNEYHYQILAKDETGNEVADEDKMVRTPLDTEGPKIENVKTDIIPIGADESTASVIISWQTNKPSTTLVEYDEGIIGGKYSMRTIEDKTLNNSHTVIIKDLKPAASYHFKIVSKDKRGNIGQSPDHTFVTPTKEKSILQLILKSLEETFAWTKNMNKFFANIGSRVKGK